MRTTRASSLLLAGVAAVSLAAAPALAEVNVKSEPVIAFAGESATIQGGNFSGLGNIPVYGVLVVSGVANYDCHNLGNPDNIVPGQNPVQAGAGTSGPVLLPTSKNGRATVPPITATVLPPATPTVDEVGCGGKGAVNNWAVELRSLEATAATFTVTQSGMTLFVWDYVKGGSPTGTMR
ncbi:hypothetical protein [Ornithinimicrobium tianjinense]|uniref:Secreted protein n=1 Tax=Ornithinimicrobium tianjinense TaxID=1195761 RepID=A0A917F1A4_9MICO|nr:hypothetical protein [Ornithinimicrobium tianjinense]GGF42422.1 hypothetical protein GCM10011366_07800 [Ornithinimicrobium tianjinense]